VLRRGTCEHGEVSLLAPLEYSALIWAVLFGYLVWQELPTPTLLAGAAIIILSSLYVVHRETVAARRRLDPAGPPSHLPDT
jgi:drug/metabolite transporter (DMT)-like permease